MNFKGAAARIADIDLPRIGRQIGVGEDELHAFMDVEAAGSGFDRQKRPKMLFEPHVFYRLLGKGAKRDAAVKAGLAYAKWGARPYPKDSYPRLLRAMEVDREKALRAASWGLTQILGDNHADAGFASVEAMVEAFKASEAAHVEATVRLLAVWKVDDDLREHRWSAIARVWNGPAHAKHDYAGRMKRAFEKWAKIKDTPFTAPLPTPRLEPGAVEVVSKATVEHVQARLRELGYAEVGPADGNAGKLTRTAILAFRQENGLPLSTEVDDVFLTALAKARPRELPRNDTPREEIRETVPEVRANWLTKLMALLLAVPAGLLTLIDGLLGNLSGARVYIEPLREMFADVPGVVWLALVAAVAVALFLVAKHGEDRGVEAYRAGARR